MDEPVSWELLRDLRAGDREAFLALGRRVRYGPGQVVCRHGDPADSLHLVEAGRLAVSMPLETGAVATVEILGPGSYFGEVALLRRNPCGTATVTVIEPATTLRIAASDFRRLCAQRPEVQHTAALLLADRLDHLSNRLLEALYVGLEERVRRRLVELCEMETRGARDGQPVVLRVTQQQLAEMAGGTRVSVNQALQRLVRSGVVTLARGRIVVVDQSRLQDSRHGR